MATTSACFDLASLTTQPVLLGFYKPYPSGDGLSGLLARMAPDTQNWASIDQAAYGLATAKLETWGTFQPVAERGDANADYFARYEPGTRAAHLVGNTEVGDGFLFRGRGYVQLTGRGNYQRIGRLLGLGDKLVETPDLALDEEIAYRVFAEGMQGGWFTGYKLSHFVAPGAAPDFVNARQVINGLDSAQQIAETAEEFAKWMAPATVEMA